MYVGGFGFSICHSCHAHIYLFIYLFISLIYQQSYQTVATKGIPYADGKARPTGTYSFPDKLSIKTNTYSLQTTTTEK